MTKHLLAGAAAFAMMTSVAFAQGMSSGSSSSTQSTTTTTTTAPAVGNYNTYENQHSTDAKGIATDTSKTFESGPAGSKSTSNSKVTSPSGVEQSASQELRTNTPDGGSTMSKKTTTTTTIDQ
jgi:hypothetical protein